MPRQVAGGDRQRNAEMGRVSDVLASRLRGGAIALCQSGVNSRAATPQIALVHDVIVDQQHRLGQLQRTRRGKYCLFIASTRRPIADDHQHWAQALARSQRELGDDIEDLARQRMDGICKRALGSKKKLQSGVYPLPLSIQVPGNIHQ